MLVKIVKGIKMFIFSDEEKNQVYREQVETNLSKEERKMLNREPQTTPFKKKKND